MVKVTAAAEVKARAWTVNTWVVSGPAPLLAWIVTVKVPPVEGTVPPKVAVPAFEPLPAAKVIHEGMPVSDTVAVGEPPVVTVNFRALPATMVSDEAEVIVAVLDDGSTLFDAAEAALVPLALVAVTVKVYAVPLVRPDTVQLVELAVQVFPSGDEGTV